MNDRRLLVATQNRGKLQELRTLLEPFQFELSSLTSIPGVALVLETERTFVENASLKASGYATQSGMLTMADDSGLEVQALGGAPGVYSARYAGEDAPDSARVAKLLLELSMAENRAARFISVVAIADPSGKILDISRGVCNGTIIDRPRGLNGFGYDPIFVPEGFDRTFAELPAEIKNQISHRAKAFQGSVKFLRSLTLR